MRAAFNEQPRAIERTDQPDSGSMARPGTALTVALLGFFVITLDALVVNVALPAIGRNLGGGMTGLLWVVDGYTLMFAALLLFAGTLSDRIGARLAYGIGLAMFVAASAACGLAPTLGVLVAARLVQGAGAAVMLPASLALIREAYLNPVQRARAIAVWAIGGAVASAAGPVVGGFLSLLSWRMIFFINLPVGVVALYLLFRIPRSPRRAVPFDWAGQVAAVVGMGTLTYGLIEGGAVGFGEPWVLGALAVAVVALATFVLAQARGGHPMVPLELFRSRVVVVSVSVGFAFMVGFYGLVFLFSLYFQELRGLSPLATGLAFMPMTALSVFVNPLAARIAERFGSRVPIATGQFLMAASLLSLCVAATGAPIALLSMLTIPIGLGAALAIPTVTALLLNSVPAERAGTASGVLNTCRQLGGALAVAVFGALVAHRETFLQGLQVSLVIAAVLLLVTASASLLLPARGTHLREIHDGPLHEKEKGDAPMTAWTSDELITIGAADELELASLRRDGTLRKPVTIWVVRHGDDLYVRSVNGRTAAWFRGTLVRHEGHIRAGGVERDVTFVEQADPGIADQIDAAYRTKYRRYDARYVDPMVAPAARAATIKLVPRDNVIPDGT